MRGKKKKKKKRQITNWVIVWEARVIFELILYENIYFFVAKRLAILYTPRLPPFTFTLWTAKPSRTEIRAAMAVEVFKI